MTPTTGTGALSTMTINTTGLAQGCYMFTLRAHGTNGDAQPVTHLQLVRFTVATTTSSGQYVDIIGFATFEIDAITANDIIGHAITGICGRCEQRGTPTGAARASRALDLNQSPSR